MVYGSIEKTHHYNMNVGYTLNIYIVFKLRLDGVMILVFNATFNNISVISWRSLLLVGKLEHS
jgi:hypothetical protein